MAYLALPSSESLLGVTHLGHLFLHLFGGDLRDGHKRLEVDEISDRNNFHRCTALTHHHQGIVLTISGVIDSLEFVLVGGIREEEGKTAQLSQGPCFANLLGDREWSLQHSTPPDNRFIAWFRRNLGRGTRGRYRPKKRRRGCMDRGGRERRRQSRGGSSRIAMVLAS